MRPLSKSYSPEAQSATKYAASQKPTVAGNLTLTAAAAATDTSGLGRIVSITSDGNDSGRTFTLTGFDEDGIAVSEAVTGPNNTTVVSTKFYTSITTIAVDAGTAGNITVGNANTTLSAVSPTLPVDVYHIIASTVAVETTGTLNYTVKETFGPIYNGTQALIWFSSPSALTAQTANKFSPTDVGIRAIKYYLNSYSTGATMTIRVNSPTNSD